MIRIKTAISVTFLSLLTCSNIGCTLVNLVGLGTQSFSSSVTVISLDRKKSPINRGSGFFIASDTVVTLHQITAGASQWSIIKNGAKEEITVSEKVLDDAYRNLTFLKVPPQDVRLLSTYDPKMILGKNTYTLSPKKNTILEGTVTGFANYNDMDIYYLPKLFPDEAYGGPVLNSDALLVGMSFQTSRDNHDVSAVIPMRYISEMLRGDYVPSEDRTKLTAKSTSPHNSAEELEMISQWKPRGLALAKTAALMRYCKKSNRHACNLLDYQFQIKSMKQKASRFFQSLCHKGSLIGCHHYGVHLRSAGKFLEAKKLFENNCKRKVYLSCGVLGLIESGLKNEARAISLLSEACLQGETSFCAFAAQKSTTETTKVPLLKKACGDGILSTCDEIRLSHSNAIPDDELTELRRTGVKWNIWRCSQAVTDSCKNLKPIGSARKSMEQFFCQKGYPDWCDH